MIGTAKRSRAAPTTLRSSQCERPFGMRRDDDLVRAEGAQRVLDRLQRVAVADLALRLDAVTRELREAGVEPALGRRARAVLVRRPGPHLRVERGTDDEHVLCTPSALRRRIASSSSPPTVSFAITRIRRSSSPLSRGTFVRCAGSSERDRSHSHAAAAVRATNTTTPSHVAIAAAATISAKYPTVSKRKR